MKILALEPFYGPSHKSFIDGWIDHSRHDFTLLTLAGNKWKWRMRHGAITLAEQVKALIEDGQQFDAVFCSDMLNLAEFLGLCGHDLGRIPAVAYFHENQLTYPVRFESERDYLYVLTNMTTMLAADAVWFNSAFHRDEFLTALRVFLKRMPDNRPLDAIDGIRDKSSVHRPGIKTFPVRSERSSGPMRIVWAARWEHDKNPEDFFAAVKKLKSAGVDFRLSVIGEQFCEIPEVFTWAKEYFADNLDHFGFRPTVEDYRRVLAGSDVFVSTANHEFFGISALEAIAAGAYPVLPNRLAYPELIGNVAGDSQDEYLYEGTVEALTEKLIALAKRLEDGKLFGEGSDLAEQAGKFCYKNLAAEMDDAIEDI
jgi:glycosyltransferase involved in cell wall biosynthesis